MKKILNWVLAATLVQPADEVDAEKEYELVALA